MSITRRETFALIGAAAIWAAGTPAAALERREAEEFVSMVADRLISIVRDASQQNPRRDEFLALFREVAALPQIGRFTMGVTWRQMSDAQKERFIEAFERFAARAYVDRIGEYKGQTLEVTGSQDAGRRGILVNSVMQVPGEQNIRIDWLVSDEGGETEIVDLVVEGVSLSIAQREEFASMLEARRGDIDQFISDLASS